MSRHYWMPEKNPPQFQDPERILISTLNVLSKSNKIIHEEKPELVIHNNVKKRMNFGPGMYDFGEKKIQINLSECRYKGYSPVIVLCHEYGHFMQGYTKRMNIDLLKRGIFKFDDEEISAKKYMQIRNQEDYEKLPWEKDANAFAEKLEPVVKRKLKLVY